MLLLRRSGSRARRRSARVVVLFAVLLPLAYLAASLGQVWAAARGDGARTAEAIVVLGAAQYDGEPSPVLRARLDHAADLYAQGLAPWVVVTGGRRDGDRVTEAAASANYLARAGVPQDQVLREVQGRTSYESLAAAARLLRDRGLRSVVLVSDPLHAARIDAIAAEVGLDSSVSPTPTSAFSGTAQIRMAARETLAVALGRVIGFRRLRNLGLQLSLEGVTTV
jgi:uncharacterized SAM-binding protein YcdF (DUF218 family)